MHYCFTEFQNKKGNPSVITVPNSFFVMHKCFIEFALLLEDRGQIRMGRSEFRKDVEGLEIESRRFFDESLLAFDIGQIVQRIGMGRTQPQCSRVTILRILKKMKIWNKNETYHLFIKCNAIKWKEPRSNLFGYSRVGRTPEKAR